MINWLGMIGGYVISYEIREWIMRFSIFNTLKRCFWSIWRCPSRIWCSCWWWNRLCILRICYLPCWLLISRVIIRTIQLFNQKDDLPRLLLSSWGPRIFRKNMAFRVWFWLFRRWSCERFGRNWSYLEIWHWSLWG